MQQLARFLHALARPKELVVERDLSLASFGEVGQRPGDDLRRAFRQSWRWDVVHGGSC
jgi:hypothetical protein